MKKFLFALVLIVPMLAFTGCGGDDDEPNNPDTPNSLGIDVKWLQENIEGEWFGYQYWNSISKIWITNSYFPNNAFVFANGKVTISDFPFNNGDFSYDVYQKDSLVYVKIGDKELWVISLDKTTKEVTFADFAKLRKR